MAEFECKTCQELGALCDYHLRKECVRLRERVDDLSARNSQLEVEKEYLEKHNLQLENELINLRVFIRQQMKQLLLGLRDD